MTKSVEHCRDLPVDGWKPDYKGLIPGPDGVIDTQIVPVSLARLMELKQYFERLIELSEWLDHCSN